MDLEKKMKIENVKSLEKDEHTIGYMELIIPFYLLSLNWVI